MFTATQNLVNKTDQDARPTFVDNSNIKTINKSRFQPEYTVSPLGFSTSTSKYVYNPSEAGNFDLFEDEIIITTTRRNGMKTRKPIVVF